MAIDAAVPPDFKTNSVEANEILQSAMTTYDIEKLYNAEKMSLPSDKLNGSWTKIRLESAALIYLSTQFTTIALKIREFTEKMNIVIGKINELNVDVEEGSILDAKIERRTSQLNNLSKKSKKDKMSEHEMAERVDYLEQKLLVYINKKGRLMKKVLLEEDLVLVEGNLGLMRKAEVLCNDSVSMRIQVFIRRVKNLKQTLEKKKEGFVKITGPTDVRSVMQIMATKAALIDFEMNFCIAKTPRSDTHEDLCRQINSIAKGEIVVESENLYKLRIDGEGRLQFSQLSPSAATLGFVE